MLLKCVVEGRGDTILVGDEAAPDPIAKLRGNSKDNSVVELGVNKIRGLIASKYFLEN